MFFFLLATSSPWLARSSESVLASNLEHCRPGYDRVGNRWLLSFLTVRFRDLLPLRFGLFLILFWIPFLYVFVCLFFFIIIFLYRSTASCRSVERSIPALTGPDEGSTETGPLREVRYLPHRNVPGESLDSKVSVLGEQYHFSLQTTRLGFFCWRKIKQFSI